MGIYDELLKKLGLEHLKDNPEKLQEAILKELGLSELKGNTEEILKRSGEILESKQREFDQTKKDLGSLLQEHTLKRKN